MKSAKKENRSRIVSFIKKVVFALTPLVLLISGAFLLGLGIADYSPALLGFPQYAKGLNLISLAAGLILWIGAFLALFVLIKNSSLVYALIASYLFIIVLLIIAIGIIFTPLFDFMGFHIVMKRTFCSLNDIGYFNNSPATGEVFTKLCNSI